MPLGLLLLVLEVGAWIVRPFLFRRGREISKAVVVGGLSLVVGREVLMVFVLEGKTLSFLSQKRR
jgi:hypothetical protein